MVSCQQVFKMFGTIILILAIVQGSYGSYYDAKTGMMYPTPTPQNPNPKPFYYPRIGKRETRIKELEKVDQGE